jgi:hypothetical protein
VPRAYAPRLSTLRLASRIRALPGIESVDILPPQTLRPRTLLRVTLEPQGMNVGTYTDFTLPEARAWLESEEETPLQRMQREERSGLAGYHVANTAGARMQCDTCPFSSSDPDAIRGHEEGPWTGRGWLGNGEKHTMKEQA